MEQRLTVNLRTEKDRALGAPRSAHAKHVVLISDGPDELEAVDVADGRDHQVTLFELNGQLGEDLRWACVLHPES